MGAEAIYRDEEFPQEPRLIIDKGFVESTMESAKEAKDAFEALPPSTGGVERWIAESKVKFFTKLEKSLTGKQEDEARYLEAQREYLQEHLEDTLRMLNRLEVKKMGMQSKNRRIVED
jgi:hypothetical protein